MELEFLQNIGGGSVSVLDRVDQIFSRKVLGGAFVSFAATMILDVTIRLLTDGLLPRLVLWVAIFLASIVVFVTWQAIEEAIDNLGE